MTTLKIGQILNFNYYEGPFQTLIAWRNKIRYGEKGPTHTGIIYDVKEEFITVAEALNNGFVISDYERWWVEGKIKEGIIRVGETIKPLNNIQENIKKYEGTPYGWIDIFHIIVYWIFGKYATKFNGPKHLICSEAVARILYDASNKQIDFEPEFNKAYDLIEPIDLQKSKQIKWLN